MSTHDPEHDPEVTEELTNLTPYLNDVGAAGGASASRLRLVEAELVTAQSEGDRFRAPSHGWPGRSHSPARAGCSKPCQNGWPEPFGGNRQAHRDCSKNLGEM